jgi:hypothetical protein
LRGPTTKSRNGEEGKEGEVEKKKRREARRATLRGARHCPSRRRAAATGNDVN